MTVARNTTYLFSIQILDGIQCQFLEIDGFQHFRKKIICKKSVSKNMTVQHTINRNSQAVTPACCSLQRALKSDYCLESLPH